MTTSPPIIDYEGSRYRTDFWEGQGREYEDLAERHAIRHLLPPAGDTLLEVGAGYGRLAELYLGYRRIILMDYSFSLLREARQRWGHDPRFLFVAASVYEMPFADHLLDALVMVRVMHHLHSPALALSEIERVLQGGKAFLLEYANKRNLKALLRYILGRQAWNPLAREPYEFAHLNYDFHPGWMRSRLEEAGFAIGRELAVSSFRLGFLKQRVPAHWLARLDAAFSRPASLLRLSPSLMALCHPQKAEMGAPGLFRCPACGNSHLSERAGGYICDHCAAQWPLVDGIYDFRRTVSRETI